MTIRREDLAEGVTLYCGNCYDVLPTLDKIDLILTDPPYGIGKAAWDNAMPMEWFGQMLPKLGETGAAYIFGDSLTLSEFQSYWSARGVMWDSRIARIYEDGPRNAAAWTTKHEDCLFYKSREHILTIPREPSIHKDKRWGDDRLVGDVWRIPRVLGNYEERADHPTQKPLALLRLPVGASSNAGNTICDPFMGSGTTGVAAVKEGRKFVGIEIEPLYFDIAVRRISDTLARPDLFIAPPKPIEKQEALL